MPDILLATTNFPAGRISPSHPNPSGWLSFLVIRLPLKNFPHSVHILEHRHGNLEESGVCPAAIGKTPTLHRKQQDDTP